MSRALPLDEIRAWDPTVPGLLGADPWRAQTLEEYLGAGGYSASLSAPASPADALAAIHAAGELSSLRGRGGAAFPTLVKLDSVAAASRDLDVRAVVVANGAEGEPLSYKDRYLLRNRPHTVLDGLLAVARATNAESAYVYVADLDSRESVLDAIDEIDMRRSGGPSLLLATAQDTYVAGEETAVVRAINTGVARPKDKPPRPYQMGVGDAPTLVLNVETLAWIAHGLNADNPPGPDRFLATISGPGIDSSLLELPMGLPVGDLLVRLTADRDQPRNVLFGGFFGGILPVTSDLELSYEGIREHGGGLGCGSLHLLGPSVCPVKVAADVVSFYAESNARQCRSCMASTHAIAEFLAGAGEPREEAIVVETLTRWSKQLPGRGACAVPDGVALLLRTLLRHHSGVLLGHQVAGCEHCASAPREGRWKHLSIDAQPTHAAAVTEDHPGNLESVR